VNPAWKSTLGYTVEELVGKTFENFLHKGDIDKTNAEYGRLLNGHVTVNFKNRYLCKDGSYKRIQWTANPCYGADKEIYEVHAAGRDVTAQKYSYCLRWGGLILSALTIGIGAVMIFMGLGGSFNWAVESPYSIGAKLTNASPGILFAIGGMILGFVVILAD